MPLQACTHNGRITSEVPTFVSQAGAPQDVSITMHRGVFEVQTLAAWLSTVFFAGVALYNGVFKSVPLKKMLLGAMLLGVGLGSTQVWGCVRLTGPAQARAHDSHVGHAYQLMLY